MANQCCTDGVGGRESRKEGLGYRIQVPLMVTNTTDWGAKYRGHPGHIQSRPPAAVIRQGLQQDVSSANRQDGWANYFSSTHSCTAAQQHGRASWRWSVSRWKRADSLGWPPYNSRRRQSTGGAQKGICRLFRKHSSEKWLHSLVFARHSFKSFKIFSLLLLSFSIISIPGGISS